MARQFLQETTSVKRKDPKTGREVTEQIERKLLFLEAVFQRAIKDSDPAAKLLWNYIDGLPPFTGRIGAMPDEPAGMDPAEEDAIKQHIKDVILGKRNGANGNGNGQR